MSEALEKHLALMDGEEDDGPEIDAVSIDEESGAVVVPDDEGEGAPVKETTPEPQPTAQWFDDKSIADLVSPDVLKEIPEGYRDKPLRHFLDERKNSVSLAQRAGERAHELEAEIKAINRKYEWLENEIKQKQPPPEPEVTDPWAKRQIDPATGFLQDSKKFFGTDMVSVIDERATEIAESRIKELMPTITEAQQLIGAQKIRMAHLSALDALQKAEQPIDMTTWDSMDTKNVLGDIIEERQFNPMVPQSFVDAYAIARYTGRIKPVRAKEETEAPEHANPPHSKSGSTTSVKSDGKGTITRPEGMTTRDFKALLEMGQGMGLKGEKLKAFITGGPTEAAGSLEQGGGGAVFYTMD